MRKKMGRRLAALAAALMVGAMSMAPLSYAAAAIEFTYAEQESKAPVKYLEMKPGEEFDLLFMGVSDYRRYKCVWVSSNEKVATVDKNGVVKAIANGSAEISMTVGDGSFYTSEPVLVQVCDMTVTVGTKENRNLRTWEMAAGGKIDLNFYGIKDWGKRKNSYIMEWESSNEDVAAVNPKDGMVTGLKKGTALIFFRIYDVEKDILLQTEPVAVTVK